MPSLSREGRGVQCKSPKTQLVRIPWRSATHRDLQYRLGSALHPSPGTITGHHPIFPSLRLPSSNQSNPTTAIPPIQLRQQPSSNQPGQQPGHRQQQVQRTQHPQNRTPSNHFAAETRLFESGGEACAGECVLASPLPWVPSHPRDSTQPCPAAAPQQRSTRSNPRPQEER